jgi:hypothetical protein
MLNQRSLLFPESGYAKDLGLFGFWCEGTCLGMT